MIRILLLVYLMIAQVWLNFNYSAFMRLGSTFNIIIPTIATIMCSCIYSIIFLYPEVIPSPLKYFNDFPNSKMYKRLLVVSISFLINIFYLYLWHVNYYSASNVWYLILYIQYIVTLIFITYTEDWYV